ncbi:peptidase S9 [Alistipes sp. An54]|uniref:S9 family peptidase n=1 Tax=Alistipes sp. An54 TaxID=1965645 RepID=UPI000B37D78B|nr:S9 family peptidase [Alistipes sp. An54]OUN79011.1 peptidase S9 [Alistipes sp. An54]
MKKIILMMALAAVGLGACDRQRPEALKIDHALTAEEIAAGRFTPEVMWKMSRAAASSLSPDGRTLLYQQTDYNVAENRGVTTLWVEDLASKAVTRLTDFTSNSLAPRWSADGGKIYFLSDRSGSMQVWEMSPTGGNVRQLSDLEGGIEGFGISPRGDKAWYVQRVQAADRRSADIHKDMDKSQARIYDDLMARHWDYWDEGEYLHLFVGDFGAEGLKPGTDIIGAEAAWDTPLAPYFDMAEIAWNNAGTMLAYTCKPLTGTAYAVSTDSDIFVYDVASGQTQNICKPTNFNTGELIESSRDNLPGYDKYPVWSPDDRMIAFLSQLRAGNESDKSRLFLYDCSTAEMRDLTEAFDYNAQNVVWEGNDRVWFIAPIEGTYQICRVAATDGEVEVLTKGDHSLTAFTTGGGRMVAERSTISSATEFFEVNTSDGSLTQISAINDAIYKNIRMGEVQKRWVRTTDGKQMLTWVILPPDFDPAQKYPTLLYCEGGPQSVVANGWSYRWNFQLMAAQGYVVVAPNRRGVPSFGQEWLDQISGDYSGQNIRDYLSAIDDVAREPWADEERMGCVGASYGGYSVYFLAGCHEKRFKAFIAHCGIFDFDSMYGETEELWFVNNDYGGPYWDRDNATAQRSYANSPHKFVEKWDTPILIFTGEKDFRIPYTQSLEAFTAARVRGIPARLVEFRDEAHQVFKPQNSMVWNREFFGWLDRYVKKAE